MVKAKKNKLSADLQQRIAAAYADNVELFTQFDDTMIQLHALNNRSESLRLSEMRESLRAEGWTPKTDPVTGEPIPMLAWREKTGQPATIFRGNRRVCGIRSCVEHDADPEISAKERSASKVPAADWHTGEQIIGAGVRIAILTGPLSRADQIAILTGDEPDQRQKRKTAREQYQHYLFFRSPAGGNLTQVSACHTLGFAARPPEYVKLESGRLPEFVSDWWCNGVPQLTDAGEPKNNRKGECITAKLSNDQLDTLYQHAKNGDPEQPAGSSKAFVEFSEALQSPGSPGREWKMTPAKAKELAVRFREAGIPELQKLVLACIGWSYKSKKLVKGLTAKQLENVEQAVLALLPEPAE